MKKISIIISLFFYWVYASDTSVTVDVTAKEHAKMRILIGIIHKEDGELAYLAGTIKRDLLFTEQFDADVKSFNREPRTQDLKQLYQGGYYLALFLSRPVLGPNIFEWRLYDTFSLHMIEGKRYVKHGSSLNGWAHAIADMIWPIMTGQEGFFSTKIAYAKEVKQQGKRYKYICIADYDGTHEQVLVPTRTVNIAPRWNYDCQHPLLFYSEYTNANVRLMVADMYGKRMIASNFEGINMLPSFSHDGTKMVYCASRGDGSCQLYYYAKGIFKRLTLNQGNNVSPSLSADGSTVYFCSDFQTGKPQIYAYRIDRGELERITDTGYCVSPQYCDKKKSVVYSKMVNGIMQLYAYHEDTKIHEQLTFDAGNKDEVSWSWCGNYLVFVHENNGRSRIAMLNYAHKEYRFITPETECCSYPAWSPVYFNYPDFSG
jgi:TolB protein